MQYPEKPDNEGQRLAELNDLGILDTEAEKEFDDIVQLASLICDAPISLITLIDANRQWIKAGVGIDATETSRDVAFCAHAIHSDEIMIVSDASKDDRFIDNPFVAGDPYIRFYAGKPLITHSGFRLGTLCIVDKQPRQLTESQKFGLETLGKQVVNLLEQRRLSRKFKVVSERLSQATQAAGIGIWDYDVVKNNIIWDDNMFRLYGISNDTFSGVYQAWRVGLHADDVLRCDLEVEMALKGEREFDTEFRVVWPDHSVRYIKAKAVVQRDERGQALRMVGTNWDITDQKLAEIQVSVSNERNRIFIEQAPSAIAMFDKKMCCMAVSKKWLQDYNLEGKQVVGLSYYEIFPEIDDDWKEIHRQCLEGAIKTCDEWMFKRADGTIQWITWDVRPWYVSKDVVGGLLMYTADITKVKAIELETRRVKEILEKTNEVARIGSWELDLEHDKIIWSKITREIHGVSDDYFPDKATALNFFKEGESRDKITEMVSKAIANGIPYDVELELLTPEGNDVWARAIGQAEFENGKCKRLYGVFHDITSRKRNEEILRNSLKETADYKYALDESSIVAITDQTGIIKFANENFCRISGYTIGELIGRDHRIVRSGYHSKDFSRELWVSIASGKIWKGELKNRAKDGRYYWVEATIVPFLDEQGKPYQYVSIQADITTRKLAEANARTSQSLLNASLESIKDVITVSVDRNYRYLYFNKAYELRLMATYDRKPELGANMLDFIRDEEDKTNTKHDFDLSFEGKSTVTTKEYNENAKLFWEVRHSPIYDDENKVIGATSFAVNVTERIRQEEKLRNYSARVESNSKEMEQFVYIASHDLREPLLTIKNYMDIFIEDYTTAVDSQGQRYVKSITNAIKRMDMLIKGLLDYSRLSKVKSLEICDADKILNDTLADLDALITRSKTKITCERLPVLAAYPLELKLVFQNLINNAIKFVSKDVQPEIHVSATKIDGGWQFIVKDNGIGIGQSDKEKIFIIFHRLNNRSEYEGTGIGLAHCKKIVELHNGRIWVESTQGEGSIFNFTILTT